MVNNTRSANFKHIIWRLPKTNGNEPPALLLQSVTCHPRYCYRALERPASLMMHIWLLQIPPTFQNIPMLMLQSVTCPSQLAPPADLQTCPYPASTAWTCKPQIRLHSLLLQSTALQRCAFREWCPSPCIVRPRYVPLKQHTGRRGPCTNSLGTRSTLSQKLAFTAPPAKTLMTGFHGRNTLRATPWLLTSSVKG